MTRVRAFRRFLAVVTACAVITLIALAVLLAFRVAAVPAPAVQSIEMSTPLGTICLMRASGSSVCTSMV